jgi:ankyrin repeat protein
LHAACEKADKFVVQILLDAGSEVNARDSERMCPLHIASKRGEERIAEVLFRAGAGLFKKDNKGRIPEKVASEAGHNGLSMRLKNWKFERH